VKNAKRALSTLIALQAVDFWVVRYHANWLSGERSLNWSLIGLGLLLLILLWNNRPYRAALSFTAAGFIGNIFSYLEYGRFVDWIPMRYWYSSVPDLVVSAGCLYLVWMIIKKQPRRTVS